MESLEFYQIYDFCGRPAQKVCNIINQDALQKFLKIYECTIEDSKSKDKAFSNELEMFKARLESEYERLEKLKLRLKQRNCFDPDLVSFEIELCKKRIRKLKNIIAKYQEA